VSAALAAALFGALLLFAHGNVPYTGFWFDEAVQFWISRGVPPFAAPHSPPGGIVAVVRENGRHNLDPGAFSVLLHVWMKFGRSPTWLRILPLAFFLAGLGAMARLGWVWRRSPLFSLFSAAVPLAYPLILYHATEVRAYSMEFAGVAIGCLLLQGLPGASAGRLAATGALLGVFMGSRYSYAIFVGAACLVLGEGALSGRSGDEPAPPRRYLALALPIAASAGLVTVLGLWPQQWRMTRYEHGALIRYLEPATAAGKTVGQLGWALVKNLLSRPALPLTVASVVTLIPARCRGGARWLGLGAVPESRAIYRLTLWVLVLSAGLWRWHPWDVGQKWSLYLHALSAVVVVRLVADVLGWLESRADLERPAHVAWTVVAVIVVGALSVNAAVHRRVHANDLTAALRHLDGLSLAEGSVAVSPHPYPTLRYLYEHGPFAGRPHYPGAFRLPHRNGPKPLIGMGVTHVITYEKPEFLEKMHPGVTVGAEASWPANLYRVGPRPSILNTREIP
jgi:hypothetical protein